MTTPPPAGLAIDPDAQAVLDLVALAGKPRWETLSPEDARVSYAAARAVLQPDPEPVAECRDLDAPGPAGPIRIRLFRPADAPAACPALVFYHGGGWVVGDLDSHDAVCRILANAARCAVLAVDYRLAPEHRFPAAVDDCAAATAWVMREAAALGLDAARIAVGGDSAGGNLAAVMAILARDGALPASPVAQLLIYPATDLAMNHPSYARVTEGVPLTATTMRWFGDHYLATATDRADWRASPLRAASLAGVTPAIVLTVGHDPLCDEGVDYAARLAREGVRVAHLHLSDQIHGFITMGRLIAASDTSLRWAAMALRRAFG